MHIAHACILAVALGAASSACAQVTTYTESASFLAALAGQNVTTEDFESAALGTIIPPASVFNGLTYDLILISPADGGLIGNLYNQIGLQGLYVERDGTPGPGPNDFFYLPESFTVQFPSPVTAAGIFFNVGASTTAADYCFVRTSTGEARTGGAFPDPTSPISGLFFAGLVSSTPFTSVEIGADANAPTGWNADNLTYAFDACYPDCDNSGALDLFDFLCFVNQFNNGDPYADCDGSGSLDLFDFLCFVNAFNTGCP